MEPISFLDGIAGYVRNSTNGAADKGIRLAVIDPAYNPFSSPYPDGIPLPKVTFEGETTLSGKAYAVASGYIPSPGARVWMVPIGNSWLIAGAATQYSAQGFYAEPDGSLVGVEFGGGSYFDTDAGLILETDAEIQGDLHSEGALTLGPRAQRVPEIRSGTVNMSTGANVSSLAATITFSPAWPTGTSLVVPAPNINSTAGSSAGVYARASAITLSQFVITLLQADTARTAGIPSGFSASVHWMVLGYPPAGT